MGGEGKGRGKGEGGDGREGEGGGEGVGPPGKILATGLVSLRQKQKTVSGRGFALDPTRKLMTLRHPLVSKPPPPQNPPHVSHHTDYS